MAKCLACGVATFNLEIELCSVHDDYLKNDIKDYIYEQRKKKITVNKKDIIEHFKDTKPYLTQKYLNKYVDYCIENGTLMFDGGLDEKQKPVRSSVSREELLKQLNQLSDMYKEEKKSDSSLGSGMHYQGFKGRR